MSYSTEHIRNVALAGHPGAGKTTLVRSPAACRRRNPDGRHDRTRHAPCPTSTRSKRSAATPSTPPSPASTTRGIHVNLIDTPGYPDFRGPTLSALAAVETVAIVVDADTGIELRHAPHDGARQGAQPVPRHRRQQDRPRRAPSSARLLDNLRETFGREVPAAQPAGRRRQARRRLLLATHRRQRPRPGRRLAPEDHRPGRRGQRNGDGPLPRPGRIRPVRARNCTTPSSNACAKATWCRCCFVSARSGAGVRELLDVAEKLFPHPGEGNPPPFVKGSGDDAQPIEAAPDPNAHVIADVFKIVNDPFVGKLGIFRVYQGTVQQGHAAVHRRRQEAVQGRRTCSSSRARTTSRSTQAMPGDIAAVAKVDEMHFDAVLHDSHDEDQIHLAPLRFPEADVRPGDRSRAARARSRSCATALHKLAEEDPCFRVEHETETNETVIRGLSDLHLRVMLERLKERYGVEVNTRPPRIAYRETIGGNGRRPPPPQEADRRRRPVRRGVPAHRTAAARRRLRVRRRGQGRHDPGPVHAGGRERRAPGARAAARSPAIRCRTCA